MKKLLCIVLIVFLLSSFCTLALAANLPAKAAQVIKEAGWEGYKAATVYTRGPAGMTYALMRKDEKNLLCVLEYDKQSKEYRLLVANENILPPGKITPKFTYRSSIDEFYIEYSIKNPSPGQPAKVVHSFFRDGTYLYNTEFTYPAGKDRLIPHASFGTSNTSLDVTLFTTDRRGNVVDSDRYFLTRASWVYDLVSFSLEQAISDIESIRSGSFREVKPPLLVPYPAKLLAGVEAGELIQLGDVFVNVDAKNVDLTSLRLTDITALTGLCAPETLNLQANHVTDLWPLAGLTNLRCIILNYNEVVDLGPLAGLHQLEDLRIPNTPVKDLSPLASCEALQALSASNCEIDSLDPLAEIKTLTYLSLYGNSITDLTPLQGLTELTYLYLSDNQIADLEPLKGLTKLKTLTIFGNPISDLSPLYDLTQLKELHISADTDAAQVKELKGKLRKCEIKKVPSK